MKFKLDENLPLSAANVFNQAGHDAVSVYDQELSGATDETVAQRWLIRANLVYYTKGCADAYWRSLWIGKTLFRLITILALVTLVLMKTN